MRFYHFDRIADVERFWGKNQRIDNVHVRKCDLKRFVEHSYGQ